MDFASVCEEAKRWSTGPDSSFEFIGSEETERRLFFGKGPISFYIICPKPGTKEWALWSDSDVVIANLGDVQDYLQSCRERSITEVLAKANKSLQVLFGASGSNDVEEDDLSDEIAIDFSEEEEEEEDTDAYYEEEDTSAMQDAHTKVPEGESISAEDFFTGQGSTMATHRLVQDLKSMKKSSGSFGVTGEPRGNNLFIWDVKLTDIPTDTLLGRDLRDFATRYKREPVVCMEMKFPKDYPMAPPFVRVTRPRFKFLTGHVTVGGSVCMEMLTRSGWRPTNDIESLLVQIRAEIMGDSKARLDDRPDKEYSEGEARTAFERMVKKYGWDK